jgi:hypothetical protein
MSMDGQVPRAAWMAGAAPLRPTPRTRDTVFLIRSTYVPDEAAEPPARRFWSIIWK